MLTSVEERIVSRMYYGVLEVLCVGWVLVGDG